MICLTSVYKLVNPAMGQLPIVSSGGRMMSHKKTALFLVLLVGLTNCQPPRVDTSGYGEYPVSDGSPQQTQRRAPGYHGEATGQQEVGVVEYDDLDDRQAAITGMLNSLVTMVMGFVRPLLTNLGVGTSNAILATMMRRRLALIPEARRSMSAVLARPKIPSATVRAS